MQADLSAIISGHREGRLSVASLRSFDAAVDHARAAGFTVQKVFLLDRPNQLTRSIFDAHADADTLRIETDFGDQGAARNAAAEAASGQLVAFLDGDDLWAAEWLTRAIRFLAEQPEDVQSIAHPEFNYFFEGQATIFRQIDQDHPDFDLDMMRLRNYWDALSVCARDLYLRFPFPPRDIAGGWAYEDWQWNAETLAAGVRHRVVPDTVLFKRRREQSQTIEAAANRSLHRRTDLADYSNPIYK